MVRVVHVSDLGCFLSPLEMADGIPSFEPDEQVPPQKVERPRTQNVLLSSDEPPKPLSCFTQIRVGKSVTRRSCE